MKILSTENWINRNCFSLIWGHSLSTQAGKPVSKNPVNASLSGEPTFTFYVRITSRYYIKGFITKNRYYGNIGDFVEFELCG